MAQRHGHGTLGRFLAHDIFIELRNDFARGHIVEGGERLLRLRGRSAVSSRRENDLFFRLGWHESFCTSPRTGQCSILPKMRDSWAGTMPAGPFVPQGETKPGAYSSSTVKF